MPKAKVLIDVDTGVDDALALRYLLQRTDIEIVGITCLAGNASLQQVVSNTRFVTLAFSDNNQISIAEGATSSIVHKKPLACVRSHGDDGLAGITSTPWYVEFMSKNNLPLSNTKNAAEFIVECSHRYSGELVILALAPLTNLALAQRLDPRFGSRLSYLVIMGGNYQEASDATTTQPVDNVEFNFASDPEAADIILQGCQAPIYIMPFETCVKSSLSIREVKSMMSAMWPNNLDHKSYSRQLVQRNFLQTCLMSEVGEFCYVWDLMAALSLITLVNKMENMDNKGDAAVNWTTHFASISLEDMTRGMLLLSCSRSKMRAEDIIAEREVKIGVSIDECLVKQCYYDTLFISS